MTVTFLPAIPTVLGIRNGVQVMEEIQPITSPISLSGFMFSLRIALPGGYFLQELNSFSPGYFTRPVPDVVVVAAPGAGAPGAGGGLVAGAVLPATVGGSAPGGPHWRFRTGGRRRVGFAPGWLVPPASS